MRRVRVLLKRLVTVLVTIIVGSLTVLAVSLWYVFDRNCDVASWESRAFSEVEWKRAQEERRYLYVADLQNGHYLAGKTRKQVAQILGEPDYESENGRYVSYIVRHFTDGGCGFNSIAYLQIRFRNDTVEHLHVGYD